MDDLRHALRAALGSLNDTAPEAEPPPLQARAAVAAVAPASLALQAARGAWADDIVEPPGRNSHRIDDFIRGPLGLGWPSADALTWAKGAAYTRDGMFEWCGAFAAAWCWGHAGLLPEIRAKRCASTVRLHAFCAGTPRQIDPEDIQAGDVVIVGQGRKPQGEHVTLAAGPPDSAGIVETYEGNAKGRGPRGDIRVGVVHRTRPLRPVGTRCPVSGLAQSHRIVWAYRWLRGDLA